MEYPDRRWGSVSIDFITSLPKTKCRFYSITTYVDQFSKRPHFTSSKNNDDSVTVAKNFHKYVFRLRGLPNIVVTDQDLKFKRKFWQGFLTLVGIEKKMSTSAHPQTDGQTECMNKAIETYLRKFFCHHGNDWDDHLTAA